MGWLFGNTSKKDDQSAAVQRQARANEGRDARAQKQLDAQQTKRKGFWDF
jgi:hypothetical protein